MHAQLRALILTLGLLAAAGASAAPDMTPADAMQAAKDGKVLLIDIRTPTEWRDTGYPQDARRLTWPTFGKDGFVEQMATLTKGDKAAPVALICRSGNRSTAAQKALEAAGFTNVHNVTEGMSGSVAGAGYVKRGLPLSTCSAEC